MKKKILSIFLILSMVFTTFIATSIKSNAYIFIGAGFGSGDARYHWGYYVKGNALCSYIRLDNWRGGSWVFDVHDQASYNELYNATGGFNPDYIGCKNQWLLTGTGWNGHNLTDFTTALRTWCNITGQNFNSWYNQCNYYKGSANSPGVKWPMSKSNGQWIWGIGLNNEYNPWETVTITESGDVKTKNALVRIDTYDTAYYKSEDGKSKIKRNARIYKDCHKDGYGITDGTTVSADKLWNGGDLTDTFMELEDYDPINIQWGNSDGNKILTNLFRENEKY